MHLMVAYDVLESVAAASAGQLARSNAVFAIDRKNLFVDNDQATCFFHRGFGKHGSTPARAE